jgi:hypothetical protein
VISAAIRIYARGALTLGVVGLIWGDFALAWLPVSSEFPAARRWRICSQPLVTDPACVRAPMRAPRRSCS